MVWFLTLRVVWDSKLNLVCTLDEPKLNISSKLFYKWGKWYLYKYVPLCYTLGVDRWVVHYYKCVKFEFDDASWTNCAPYILRLLTNCTCIPICLLLNLTTGYNILFHNNIDHFMKHYYYAHLITQVK